MDHKRVSHIELVPTKISSFSVRKLQASEEEYHWLWNTMKRLCGQLGTKLHLMENKSFMIKNE